MHHYYETFTITNEKGYERSKSGFKAYNSQGEYVGIVFMTDDKRRSSFGNCEFCFCREFRGKYGEWHRITSHGSPIRYSVLCDRLKNQPSLTIYVD